MSNTNFGKLDQIRKFVKESKIFIDDDLLTFKNVDDAGVGIFAKKDISEDTIIVKIPKQPFSQPKTARSVIYWTTRI